MALILSKLLPPHTLTSSHPHYLTPSPPHTSPPSSPRQPHSLTRTQCTSPTITPQPPTPHTITLSPPHLIVTFTASHPHHLAHPVTFTTSHVHNVPLPPSLHNLPPLTPSPLTPSHHHPSPPHTTLLHAHPRTARTPTNNPATSTGPRGSRPYRVASHAQWRHCCTFARSGTGSQDVWSSPSTRPTPRRPPCARVVVK